MLISFIILQEIQKKKKGGGEGEESLSHQQSHGLFVLYILYQIKHTYPFSFLRQYSKS